MLCPKCGMDYQGNSCPKCNAPEILINNEDYLRRRKAYEEKQAGINKSASSDSETSSKGQALEEIYARVRKTGVKLAGSARKVADKASAKSDKTLDDTDKVKINKIASNKKLYLFGVAGLIIIIAIIVGAVILSGNFKNRKMYFSDENSIYQLCKGKTEYVCGVDEAIFEADDKAFYVPKNIPQTVSESVLISAQASSGGKYFAASFYNESDNDYSVILWNEKKDITITKLTQRADILYVTDNGSVIYTVLDILNDEGSVGSYELYIYEAVDRKTALDAGAIVLIEDNLKRAYVYAKADTIIYHTNDNVLYSYQYGKGKESKLLAENVSEVYTLADNSGRLYSYKAENVYLGVDADSLIYNISGKCYNKNLVSDEDTYITELTGTKAEFLYDGKDVYILENSKISVMTDEVVEDEMEVKKTVRAIKHIDAINSFSDVLYLSDGDLIVYINSSQQLCKINKKQSKLLAENVTFGSLKRLENSKQGITYISRNVQYVKIALNKSAVVLPELSADKKVMIYNNNLYYINKSGQLCTSKTDVSNESHMGEAEYYWCK